MCPKDVSLEMIADLNRHNYDISNVHEFYTLTCTLDDNSVKILLNWLPMLSSSDVDNQYKSDIVAFLHRKKRRGVDLNVIINVFSHEDNNEIRWDYANVIHKYANKKHVDKILDIVVKKHFGTSRKLLVTALGRQQMKSDATISTLISLLNDDDVYVYAIDSLGKLGDRRAIEHIKQFYSHDNKAVRKLALKTVLKIEGSKNESSAKT